MTSLCMVDLQEHVLRQLACGELPAMQEVHARLLRLYPDVDIAHMPSDLMQGWTTQDVFSGARLAPVAVDGSGGSKPADCDQFVANAATAGDTFAWHIDADPAGATASLARQLTSRVELHYVRQS